MIDDCLYFRILTCMLIFSSFLDLRAPRATSTSTAVISKIKWDGLQNLVGLTVKLILWKFSTLAFVIHKLSLETKTFKIKWLEAYFHKQRIKKLKQVHCKQRITRNNENNKCQKCSIYHSILDQRGGQQMKCSHQALFSVLLAP